MAFNLDELKKEISKKSVVEKTVNKVIQAKPPTNKKSEPASKKNEPVSKKDEPTRRKQITEEAKKSLQEAQADYAVPKFMRNTAEGLFDNSLLGLGYSLKTGEKLSASNNDGSDLYQRQHAGLPATAGQLLGSGLAFASQSALASPLTSKVGKMVVDNSKLGQTISNKFGRPLAEGLAENLVDAETVGLLQNLGMGAAQGLKGKELFNDVMQNTALDIGFGSALQGIGAGLGKLADMPKTVDLPTAKSPAEEVVEPVVKRAETVDFEPKKATPMQVGKVTTVKNPYEGTKPTQTLKADRKTPEISQKTKDDSVKFKDLGADTNKTPPKYKQSQSIANEKLGGEYEYETTTHAKRNRAAQQRTEVDRAGEYDDLTTKQYYTDEDFATARKLFDEETSAGNNEKATRLLRKVAEQSSLKGQELEAVKHLKDNTPSGKVYKAQQEAVRGEKKIADKNPAQHKKATGDVKKFTDIVNKSAKDATNKEEFVSNVKNEIDKLLAPKVKNVKNTALRNEIFEMVENLKTFDADNVDNLIDEIGTLIKSRYGIPVVSSKQANEIIDYMQKAENAVSPREKEILIARADQIIADIQKSTAKEKLKSLQRISLLSNPKTLLSRNMGGNLLLAGAETLKDLPATFFDQLVSLKTGQRTTTAFDGGKYAESVKGLGKGLADQFSDIKNRVDTSPSRGQYELPNKTIWDYKKSETGVGRVFNKSMNFLDKVIGKSLQFGDRPFYEAAYKSRKAELEALVKKGKSTLTPEEINESARLFALDRTFQSDTELSKWAGQLRDTLPFGNLIVPFTQTPANIIDKLLDYSPAGLARACMQLGNVKNGTFDQKRFVDALGRTFTGSGAIMLGYALYKKGLMTTDIYQEGGKDENNARTLAGEQSYSLKLGDTYISIDWADPVGSLLMIGADFGRGLGEKEELLSVLTGGVTTAVDGVFDRSFLSGLTDLFDNISNEGVLSGVLETFISQIGSQVVPNVVKSINRVADPVKRETYDANILKKQLNVVKSGIPGLSKTLPAKINVAGEEVQQYQGRDAKDRAIESLIAPYNKTVTNNHEINDYLIDLYEKTGNDGVLLDQTAKSFSYNGAQYKLKNAEELSRMQKTQGQEAVKAVKELKKSKDFRKSSDAEKVKKVTNALSDAREKSIEDYLIHSGEYTRTEIEFNKLSTARKEKFDQNKVSKEVYYKYFDALAEADANNSNAKKRNNSYDQKEAKKALNSMDLTYAQKQYLWACTNSRWKAY